MKKSKIGRDNVVLVEKPKITATSYLNVSSREGAIFMPMGGSIKVRDNASIELESNNGEFVITTHSCK